MAREHVQARIERFINHHIATILKPLDDLTRAEDLQGIAKGIAYQLAENLGVLFRRDVAEDVKSLDQDGRASLRKYGIRFGAYHVFMPALLKPAPAELITLLWALKNDALTSPGYGDLIPALAAGRTSIVTDHAFERNFYRLAGFRFLGKRAVRIDILERLADLIRPLLQWKPGAPSRPDGAYDGRRFVTTPAMLSILGATADDMEEILKGLGYRADAVSADEAATHLAAHKPAAITAAEAVPSEPVAETAGSATDESADAGKEAPETEAAIQAVSTEITETVPTPVETAPEEEKRVLLWRPGGGKPDHQQRGANQERGARRENAGRRSGERRGEQKSDPAQGARPQGEQRPQGERPPENRSQPRERNEDRKDRNGEKAGRNGEKRQDNRPRGDRPDHGNRPDKHSKPHQAQPQRFEAKPRKDKPIDPDSPFAKLAILKEQMKK
jgi:ATP-dependent RNA helicase SUPV3L1/SUV3